MRVIEQEKHLLTHWSIHVAPTAGDGGVPHPARNLVARPIRSRATWDFWNIYFHKNNTFTKISYICALKLMWSLCKHFCFFEQLNKTQLYFIHTIFKSIYRIFHYFNCRLYSFGHLVLSIHVHCVKYKNRRIAAAYETTGRLDTSLFYYFDWELYWHNYCTMAFHETCLKFKIKKHYIKTWKICHIRHYLFIIK